MAYGYEIFWDPVWKSYDILRFVISKLEYKKLKGLLTTITSTDYTESRTCEHPVKYVQHSMTSCEHSVKFEQDSVSYCTQPVNSVQDSVSSCTHSVNCVHYSVSYCTQPVNSVQDSVSSCTHSVKCVHDSVSYCTPFVKCVQDSVWSCTQLTILPVLIYFIVPAITLPNYLPHNKYTWS